MARFPQYLSAQNDEVGFGGIGSNCQLQAVNVTTKTASAVVTIYNGTSTSGDVVAVIDASALGCYQFENLRCPNGVYAKLTGAGAGVTITAGDP